MLEKLFPREGTEFFGFFQEHAEKSIQAGTILRALFESPVDAKLHAARVKQLEHEGDDITHRVIETLHQVFLAPIDRGDIHRLISRLDDVLDLIDSTAERAWLYEIREVEPAARELTDTLNRTLAEVAKGLTQLPNRRDTDSIVQTCQEISRLEKEGDRILRSGMARLFQGTDPVHVMIWKEILHYLEEATDRCEDVADVLEGIAIGYA